MIETALRTLIRGLRPDGEADTGRREAGGTGRRALGGSSASDDETLDHDSTGTPDEPPDRAEGAAGTRTRSDIITETGMTPSEFVCELLEAHGGRAYQGTVGEETGLSKSATSRLLTQMEEDGQVTRLCIGREKVVCLPDREPEIAENPDVEELPSGA